ncbi:MAG: sigma-54-dependent Fis family transcriptional regulator [Planctomycetes bacterium]|nr:sigma-54-dependent Fis family transcriptional regulator [Planctomycetota bacterium]
MATVPDPLQVLIVEDEPAMRDLIGEVVRARGHRVTVCADGESAWESWQREGQALVLLDWMLPGLPGPDLCRRLRAHPRGEGAVVVMITSQTRPEDIETALEAGADDFIAKPFDLSLLAVRLTIAERRAREAASLLECRDRIELLEEQTRSRDALQGIVGKSPAIQEVFRRLRLAAQSDVTVLLTGETGTGKELAARAIHALSHRSDRPFIGVNCSALPDSLLESELFGHVKGAFTHAVRDKAGVFEAAQGGTLFIDEVGDTSPALQLKLLRVLQEHEIRRVGDEREMKIDARVVAATNKDMEQLVADGSVREDFFYRIRVFEIALPPLRERGEDIPLLVEQFVAEFRRTRSRKIRGVAPEALRTLMSHDWPGNIRELRNAVEHAFVVATGDRIRRGDLPGHVGGVPAYTSGTGGQAARATPGGRGARPAPGRADRRRLPGPRGDSAERKRILDALRASGGSRSLAAKHLGYSRVTLWKKMRQWGIMLS